MVSSSTQMTQFLSPSLATWVCCFPPPQSQTSPPGSSQSGHCQECGQQVGQSFQAGREGPGAEPGVELEKGGCSRQSLGGRLGTVSRHGSQFARMCACFPCSHSRDRATVGPAAPGGNSLHCAKSWEIAMASWACGLAQPAQGVLSSHGASGSNPRL